jgi:hypothetical protein
MGLCSRVSTVLFPVSSSVSWTARTRNGAREAEAIYLFHAAPWQARRMIRSGEMALKEREQ